MIGDNPGDIDSFFHFQRRWHQQVNIIISIVSGSRIRAVAAVVGDGDHVGDGIDARRKGLADGDNVGDRPDVIDVEVAG